jgi:hypothetical protein
LARYYSARLGRFMSADPLAGDVSDPQSLNRRYADVQNNPTNFTDPTGMFIYVGPTRPSPPPPPIGPVYTGGGGGSPFEPTDPKDCEGGCPPTWKDQKPPKPRETKKSVFACAADFGNKYSIAGLLHGLGVPNGGVAGFVTDALGGNAFSGLTNVILSAKNGSAGGHGFAYNSAQSHLQGPTQGIVPPGTVRGPWAASPASAATGAIVRGAFSLANTSQTLTMLSGEVSLTSTSLTAAQFASRFVAVKFGYDFLSYAAGAAACAVGLSH